VRRLRREVKALREEREIRRKAAAWFAGRPTRSRQGIRVPGGAPRGHRVPGAGRLRQRVLRVAVSAPLGPGPGGLGAERAGPDDHERSRGTDGHRGSMPSWRPGASTWAASGSRAHASGPTWPGSVGGGTSGRCGVIPRPGPLPTWSSAPSRPRGRFGCGSTTSRTSRPGRGFLYLAVVLDAW
jgi:hypothetical protein